MRVNNKKDEGLSLQNKEANVEGINLSVVFILLLSAMKWSLCKIYVGSFG